MHARPPFGHICVHARQSFGHVPPAGARIYLRVAPINSRRVKFKTNQNKSYRKINALQLFYIEQIKCLLKLDTKIWSHKKTNMSAMDWTTENLHTIFGKLLATYHNTLLNIISLLLQLRKHSFFSNVGKGIINPV